ncbi:MAG: hypothetical protein AAGD32_11880, partial [Planctomycetota bacterium]
MADEPQDNPDVSEDGEDSSKKKGGILGLLMKTPVLVGGAMVLEAIALFIGFKMLGGGPDESAAALQAELDHGEVQYDSHGDPIPVDDHGGDFAGETMLSIAEVRAHNTKSGRDYIFDVTFYAMVDKAEAESIQEQITTFQPLIQDRARTIIADLDPAKLSGSEPGLETLRRKMMHEMDEIRLRPGQLCRVEVCNNGASTVLNQGLERGDLFLD